MLVALYTQIFENSVTYQFCVVTLSNCTQKAIPAKTVTFAKHINFHLPRCVLPPKPMYSHLDMCTTTLIRMPPPKFVYQASPNWVKGSLYFPFE